MGITVSRATTLYPLVDAYLRRTMAEGAAPVPLIELNTHMPTLGPFRIQGEGFYDLVCTPGPLMTVRLERASGNGRLLGVA